VRFQRIFEVKKEIPVSFWRTPMKGLRAVNLSSPAPFVSLPRSVQCQQSCRKNLQSGGASMIFRLAHNLVLAVSFLNVPALVALAQQPENNQGTFYTAQAGGSQMKLKNPRAPETTVPKIKSRDARGNVGNTRSRVCFFMNRFMQSGFIDYTP